jgi:hypothetical protein
MSVQGEIKGDKLILTIDVGEAARKAAVPSGSGKTMLVATTGGFTRFGDLSLSLNLTLPNPEHVKVVK